jgi:predicted Zn-dependent peptidase
MKVIKKTVLFTLLNLFFVCAAFAQSSGNPSASEQANSVTEFEVNGLKVLVKRRPNAPTVAAGLFIRGGARNITDKNAGIEQMMLSASTEGSKKFPREVVRREISRTGSSIGATAGKDYSVMSMAVTRGNFERLWEIFADLAMNPTFSNEAVEYTRSQILTGLREQETDNDNFLKILQDRVVYANHPYANEVGGTIENVNRFTAKDLTDFHQKMMQTSQLLLIVVGDLDPKDVQAKVAATLGKLPRGTYKEKVFPALDFSKPTLDITSRSLPTNYVQGVFNAPSLNHPDYYAMRIAITILQSLVYQEVRVKRQLSYAPNAELDSNASNTGNIYVTAVDANQAVQVMLEQINDLKTRELNDEIIKSIAGFFLTNYYIEQQTNMAQVGELARYELIGGGWRNSFEFLTRVRRVKAADVKTAAEKYMKNIRFVVIGNPTAIDKNIFVGSR